MKIIPSETLRKHLEEEQNVIMPDGGFDIPGEAYAEISNDVRTHPFFARESEASIVDRIDYAAISRFHGVQQNGGATGTELQGVQKTAALTRQIVQMADSHIPNAVKDISQAVEDSSKVIHNALAQGHAKVESAILDLKRFEGESHAEVIKVKSELHAELTEVVTRYGKLIVGALGGILFMLILIALLSHPAHGQSTVVRGASKGSTTGAPITSTSVDANHTALDIVCQSGCAGSSGSTTPSNAFANPTTAGMAMSFNAMWNGTSWDLVKGDTTNGLWVNCKTGCAGGSSTPSDAFANPSATAGLTMGFTMLWNGSTWDRVKGDTTNGLWVNCKNGCAGGSSTPSDTFANPTTAGLNQGFMMMWNGATWDRVKGDTTSGLWVNVKAALPAGSNVIGHVIADSGSTTAVTGNVAVTEADGANVTLGAKADAKSTATDTTAVTIMQVLKQISASVQAPPSQAVTNAGTFATQATLSAETTKVIGTVNIAASQTVGLAAGSAVIGHVINDASSAVIGHVITDSGSVVQGTIGDNGGAATTNRVAALPAIAQATPPAAATAGRDAALLTDLHRIAYTSVMPTDVTSYVASKQGLASAASATDIAVLSGNASNAVIVTKIMVSCTQTTAGIIDLVLLKRSTADTAGTSTGSPTTVPLDSSNAAGSSAVLTYTANPTTGSLVGNVDVVKLGCMATGTAAPNDIYIWRPSMGQSIVLRGTAQQIAVNLNAATVTGGSFNITIQWIEATNY